MSIFRTVETPCPDCGTSVEFELVYSVAADRRPDLREAILDGSFQRGSCPGCGLKFRADPEFSYVDIGRGQYIGVWPAAERGRWRECAARTQQVFDGTLGAGATAEAQEIGRRLEPRVVFGWPALVEKLIARQAGLDDRTLEVAKVAVLRSGEEIEPPGEREYRLVDMADDDPVFAWVDSADGTIEDAVRVPRQLLNDIESDPGRWQAMRDAVAEGLVVDFQREALAG